MNNYDKTLIKQLSLQAKKNDDRVPFYVFDINVLKEHLQAIRKIAQSCKIIYSVKANPMLISAVNNLVDGFEVSSSGELEICENNGINPDKIIFTGVLKTLEDMRQAIRYDVRIISIESPEQLEILKQLKSSDFPSQTIQIMLRLTSNNQLGMDEETIAQIINDSENLLSAGIHIKGLHYFHGTQNKIEKMIEQIHYVSNFAHALEEKYNMSWQFIEFGSGMKVDYFSQSEESKYEELQSFINATKDISLPVQIEFGRFIAAFCGYYVAKVLDVKYNNGINYAILNGGKGHLTYMGSNNGMRIPPLLHIQDGEILPMQDFGENWSLCGPICNDIIVRTISIPQIKKNDLFVFMCCGAYSPLESMFLFLSRQLPEIYFYENTTLTRVRESIKSSEINSVNLLK